MGHENIETVLFQTPLTNRSTEKTLNSRFPGSSEASASELPENLELSVYQEILKKCFFGATWTVLLSAGSNLQPHTDVWPVACSLTR